MRPATSPRLAGSLPLLVSLGLATSAHAFTPSGSDIVYEVDNKSFEGYLATADGESRGAVLIIHDWNGLDDYERQRADEHSWSAFLDLLEEVL
ncbi:hypothetical protein [Halomonas sp. DQ26W]|uniref:hypothetical protein n=1 Tax=Halomonas sp. DQ26W TaxID=2282311 RepID=UPI0015F0A4C6|nr:hypothetical protein [Halomonas sp. DQ26W]